MNNLIYVLITVFLISNNAYAVTKTPAKDITTNTTNFNGNLSPSDTDVQKALQTLNDMSTEIGTVNWGDITGTLSNQTDLQDALNAKQDLLPSQTGNAGKFLTTDGSSLNWSTVTSGITGVNWGQITGNINSQNWQSTSPFLGRGAVNWLDLQQNIQTSGINWQSVVNQEIQSSGVNWSSLVRAIQTGGINWQSVINSEIQRQGINWSSTNIFPTSATGNVGIGSPSPSKLLDVAGTAKAAAFVAGNITGSTQCIQADSSGNLTGTGSACGSGGGISGLTTNYVTKASSSTTIGDSQIIDNGTNVGIGSAVPQSKLDVNGGVTATVLTTTGTGDSYFNSGNVAVGTTVASTKLTVVGTVNATAFVGDGSGLTGISSISGLTTNYLPKATSSTSIGNSIVAEVSSNIGVGSAVPNQKVTVAGNVGVAAGSASAPSITTYSNTNTGLFFPATSVLAVATAGTERLRVDSSGNVGVGTDTPTAKFQVSSVGDSYFGSNVGIGSVAPSKALDVTGTARASAFIASNITGSTQCVHADSSGNLTGTGSDCGAGGGSNYWTLGSDNVSINTTYNIGLGSVNPTQKLDIAGTSKATAFTDGTASLTGGSLTNVKLGSLTTNGFVKTGSSNGTLSVDTNTYCQSSGTGCPGTITGFANPSASIGLTAVNGSATTALRSDGAPALSQAISPTWTGNHVFAPSSGDTFVTAGNFAIGTASATELLYVSKTSASATANINTRSGTAANTSTLNLSRASATNGNLTVSDEVGSINFSSMANGTASDTARIASQYTGDGTTKSGQLKLLTANNNANPTERMVIQSDGNVGIGFSSGGTPGAALDIKKGGNSNGVGLRVTNTTSGDYFSVIDGGNVGINTAIPTAKLQVVGTVNATAFVGDGSGLTGISGGTPGGSSPQIQWNNGGSFAGVSKSSADSNGNIGLGTTTPQGKFVVTTGNVGIGTWVPNSLLQLGNGTSGMTFSTSSGINMLSSGAGVVTGSNSTSQFFVISSVDGSGLTIRGRDTSAGSAGPVTIRSGQDGSTGNGSSAALTINGGDVTGNSAFNGGATTLRGGDVSGATGSGRAGDLTIRPGGATGSSATSGRLILSNTFKATAGDFGALNNVACLIADNRVGDCPTSSTNALGVGIGTTSPAIVQWGGIATQVPFDGTYSPSAGWYACTSATTAGKVLPQSTACGAGRQVGVITVGATSVGVGTFMVQFK